MRPLIFCRSVLVHLLAALALAQPVWAQDWPTKPIRIVVPHPPGVGIDVDARVLAARMAEDLGQQVIVENRPGGGTLLATEAVARAAPDGYTVGISTPAGLAAHPRLYDRPAFNVERDLAPVSLLWRHPWAVFVHRDVPATTLADLLALARNRPDTLNYATTGVGSFQQLSVEWMMSLTGGHMRHIPYGTNPWLPDLLSGRVQVVHWTVSSMVEHVKAGKLRMLAVSNQGRRSEQLPDVPTFAEAGLQAFDVTVWAGMVVPAGTPKAVIDALAASASRAAHTQAFRQHLSDGGGSAVASTPAEFDSFLRSERRRWHQVIIDAGIRLE
jgi:tripartite-type tricarboxylate transporter receptor subunit TctC